MRYEIFSLNLHHKTKINVVVVVDRLWSVRARFQTGAINTGKILSKSAVVEINIRNRKQNLRKS